MEEIFNTIDRVIDQKIADMKQGWSESPIELKVFGVFSGVLGIVLCYFLLF
jgi:hypothetical protein